MEEELTSRRQSLNKAEDLQCRARRVAAEAVDSTTTTLGNKGRIRCKFSFFRKYLDQSLGEGKAVKWDSSQ